MHNSGKTSYKVALGGVVSALCLTLMFMTGVFPILSMAIPIYAGALMIIIATEVSTSWAFAAFFSVSILSLFLTPDKEASTLFIMFFGYYPIISPKLDSIKFSLGRLILKFGVFNIAMVIWYRLIIMIMGVYDFFGDFSFLGEYAVIGVMVFINLVFLLYDYTIQMVRDVYIKWFRPTYFGKKKSKTNAR
ncbi:MAG: hypothetical protein J6A37_03850 [Oscillospiraceae bacterium]|nr:hypothetical protein [Oscillospiraceae bacterium]